MKPSFIFTLLLLSILYCHQAQGITFENSIISSSNHQELITKTSSSNIQEDEPAMVTKLSSGINRKLMTKTIFSSPTTSNSKVQNYKNDPKSDHVKFTHQPKGKEEISPTSISIPVNSENGKTEVVSERYPDVIDITGMDYSPAKRKPPIHN